MDIKCIIYDFDGVICDSVGVKTKAFVKLFEPFGIEIQEKVKEYHLANGGISRFEKIKYFFNKLMNKSISNEEIKIYANEFSLLVKDNVIKSNYINGAYEFIKNHHDGMLQFICTGTPQEEIEEIVLRKGINSFFKGIYGSPLSKKDIISNILANSNLHPSQCIYFGDALTDFEAAIFFGIRFIGIINNDTVFPDGTETIEDFVGFKLI